MPHYVTVPDAMTDLAITRLQHDRMVENAQHPITWHPDHTHRSRSWGPNDQYAGFHTDLRASA